jgi:hypothetical protein
MTKLILRTLLKIKGHVDEMCSEVTKDYSKLVVQAANTNREQARRTHSCGGPGWIRCLPTPREEVGGYELSAGRTVTDMSRTDWQRVSDVFPKCGNKSAMWHETIRIFCEENKPHLFWKSLSISSMTLQPLLGPGLPQKTPPFFSHFCPSSLLEKRCQLIFESGL